MNREFNYQRLLKISETQEPYRGSENRFPFSDRKYGHKYFFKDVVDGVPQFRLCYYYRKDISEPNVFGIVRSDNTIEFDMGGRYMHQGLRQIMSRGYFNGVFNSSVRHGGIIYSKKIDKENNTWRVIPIFRGLRMNMDTLELHESSKYTFVKKTLDRKKSKEFLAKYENAYKVAEVMYVNLEQDKVSDIIKEIGREHFPKYWVENGNYGYLDIDNPKEVMDKADEILESSPFDSFILYINALNLWWKYSSNIKENYNRAKKRIYKVIQKNNDVFNVKEFDYTQNISSSAWGLDIKVNNNFVYRYL
ncbi:hypothetical protein CCP3SC1AL1_1120020 [Gammaproteobacteria bacterium]